MPYTLDFRVHLPLIQAAVATQALQCYAAEPAARCVYAGPCAVGACLPVPLRHQLDALADSADREVMVQAAVDWQLSHKALLECPPGQYGDWAKLQNMHDAATITRGAAKRLELDQLEYFVSRLAAKYAARQPDGAAPAPAAQPACSPEPASA